jgi:hypothetical protein
MVILPCFHKNYVTITSKAANSNQRCNQRHIMNQEVQQNQEDTVNPDVNKVVMMPHIEEGVPIPKHSREALPEMNNEDQVRLRSKTYKEISDLTGHDIDPTPEQREAAEKMMKEMITNPGKKQDLKQYANDQVAYLGGLVDIYNHAIVDDLAELKQYVVAKLVYAVEHTQNVKEQIAALRSIGEIDGVDAFKKKTEVIHKHETMEEVETELLAMLSELKQKAVLKPKSQTIDAELVEDDTSETEDD